MIHDRVSGEICSVMDIDKILKERANLLERLKKIDAFIAAYESYAGTKIDQNDLFGSNPELPNQSSPQATIPKKMIRRLTPALIAKLSERVIREHGEPMKRGDIVSAIEALGTEIRSSDKNRYVGTILWRNFDTFANIDGHGYWVRALGAPPNLPEWNDVYSSYKKMLSE